MAVIIDIDIFQVLVMWSISMYDFHAIELIARTVLSTVIIIDD